MNRQLIVSAAESEENGIIIVSSTFEDFCQAFLGSADYYALCKVSKTVYLKGLRRFRADELDFVRRFITLVDLAYEAKTRIICLSSVPLFEVFANIVPTSIPVETDVLAHMEQIMTVKGKGGSSSSMMVGVTLLNLLLSVFIMRPVDTFMVEVSDAKLRPGPPSCHA